MPYVTKDSGERMEFETGSRRDTNKGKTRPGLIGPELKRRLGDLMARGADKYGDGNWRLGQKASRYLDSLERHLLQWEEGDDTEDHLAAIVFNVMGIMHLEKHMPEHLDHERYELAKTHPDNVLMRQHEAQFEEKPKNKPIEDARLNPELFRKLGLTMEAITEPILMYGMRREYSGWTAEPRKVSDYLKQKRSLDLNEAE